MMPRFSELLVLPKSINVVVYVTYYQTFIVYIYSMDYTMEGNICIYIYVYRAKVREQQWCSVESVTLSVVNCCVEASADGYLWLLLIFYKVVRERERERK